MLHCLKMQGLQLCLSEIFNSYFYLSPEGNVCSLQGRCEQQLQGELAQQWFFPQLPEVVLVETLHRIRLDVSVVFNPELSGSRTWQVLLLSVTFWSYFKKRIKITQYS